MTAGKKFYSRRVFVVHGLLLAAVAVAAYLSVRAQFEALRDQLLEESRTDQQLMTRAGVLALQSQFRLLINGLTEADQPAEVEGTVPAGWLTGLSLVDRQSRTVFRIAKGSATQADTALAEAGWLTRVVAPSVWVSDEGSVVVGVPVHGGKSVAVGVVASDQITQDLAAMTSRSGASAGGVSLITEDGQVLASSTAKVGTWLQSSLDRTIQKRLDALIATGNAGSELIDRAGVTLLSVQPFVAVPGVRWRIVSIHAGVSDAVSQRLQPLFWQLLSLASVMLVAVAVVLVSTAVSLTRTRRRIEKIRTEMIDRDLKKARRIQLNWLPAPLFEGANVSIAAENKPAQHISGDFYNWFELPPDEDDRGRKTVIVIGDVSGHGLPAAFLMATTQLLVKNTMPNIRDPGDCLAEVNHQLCSMVYNGQFVTMMILVLDHDTAGLEIASAGHPSPLLKRDGRVEQLPVETQLVVGVDDSVEYQTQRFRTRPGDTFLLYTDGAIEQPDADGEQFTVERLMKAFAVAAEHPRDVVETVNRILDDFRGPVDADDDLTLLAAQVVQNELGPDVAAITPVTASGDGPPAYDGR